MVGGKQMKKTITAILCLVLFVCGSGTVFSLDADYGAALSGEFRAGAIDPEGGSETGNEGKILLAPWLSFPAGSGSFYISAGLNAKFSEQSIFIPELLQLEFYHRFDSLSLRAGRIPWQDTSAFTAKGRFDGIELVLDTGKILLGAAGFYTGLLCKDTADINYSPADPKNYHVDFDWNNFGETYFAPRRVLASVYGEFPGLPFRRGNVYVGLLAQLDMSEAGERYNTQYLLLRHTLDYKFFDLDASGAVALENTEEDGIKAAFAFALDGGVRIQGNLKKRLSLGVKWASGKGPDTAAFFPVVREAQGYVLKPCFSGIMAAGINFEARLMPSLSAEIGGRYFLRTDAWSFTDPDITKEEYALGFETYGQMLWVPYSDLSFSLEGGVFLPQTGTAMRDDKHPDGAAPVRWSVALAAIFSL